jgi:hypothetical protein
LDVLLSTLGAAATALLYQMHAQVKNWQLGRCTFPVISSH